MNKAIKAAELREWAGDLTLASQPESETLEKLKSVNLSAIGRTVCAFLNSKGGRILVGIDEEGHFIPVPKIDEAVESIEKELFSRVQPPAACVVTKILVQGELLVLLEVAPGADGPYTYGSKIYIRQGESTQKATSEQVRAIVLQLASTPRWEAQTYLGAEISDLDKEELTRTTEDVYRRRYEALPNEPERLLDALYLLRNGALTNASLVLYAQEPARFLPQTRVRAVYYADESREEMLDNQVFSGHIFRLYERMTGFLQKNLSVQASLSNSTDGARAEWLTYPPDALREALLNALIHRDYSQIEGSIRLTLFPRRLEIWNTGELPAGVTIKTLREGGISQLRNQDIAHVLLLRSLIERMGTGGRRIVALCKAAGLPAPQWQERGGGTQLTFFLPENSQGGVGDKKDVSLTLNPRVLNFVKSLAPGQQFTAREYQQRAAAEVSDRQGRLDLAQMVKAKAAERRGSGHNTHYVRTEREIL